MATSASGKGSKDPIKLKATLSELESALTSWDQLPEQPIDQAAQPTGATSGRGRAVPDEMRRRTRELLDQLKSQIDELSAE